MSTSHWVTTLSPSAHEIADALAAADSRFESATVVGPVAEGWSNRIFRATDKNGQVWILRVPRRHFPPADCEAENRLIAEVASQVPYYVPVAELRAELPESVAFFGARPAPGECIRELVASGNFDPAAFGHSFGAAIRQLHRLQPPSARPLYAQRYQESRTQNALRLPALIDATGDQNLVRMQSWLADSDWPEPVGPVVFSHEDIWPDNLFADPATSHLTGIIDWSGARFGWPATDFMENSLHFGDRFLAPALASYGRDQDPSFRRFIQRYSLLYVPMILSARLAGAPGAEPEYFLNLLADRVAEGWMER